jgi:Protein of unknown function (DUF3383)
MNPSIPANQFVNVIPSVLAAGAADLGMNAVFVDNSGDDSIPVGTVQAFGNAQSVAEWYGPTSVQAALAALYFAGYNGATSLPALLYFTQYNDSAVGAYLRGGALTGVTLTELQLLSGELTIDIDGRIVSATGIDLSGATSFSNAAAIIQGSSGSGLQVTGGIWTGTATTNGTTTVNIISTGSGALHVGDQIVAAHADITTPIVSFGTYTVLAGTGTVHIGSAATGSNVAEAGTVTSAATCEYDSQLNAFVIESATTGATSTIGYPDTTSLSTGLYLTAAKGAVLSQGAAAATPASVMDAVVADTQDWATFMTVVDPDSGAVGGPIKLAFSTWNAAQNAAYAYVAYDSDPTPATELNDSACYGALVAALEGTIPIWSASQGASIAAFICGLTASINWNRTGGRTTYAYRSSPALAPDVNSLDVYLNLKGNGYNSYCDVATRTAAFQWFQPGLITSDWDWIDPYVNQIYWNARFQSDFAALLTNVPDVPYTQAGYNMIRAALAPDIQAMGAFGAWKPGVQLSGAQAVAVNSAAGLVIAPILQSQGWYLQITDPGPTVRAARGSPICTFWYTDGGSVQQIIMASIDIE